MDENIKNYEEIYQWMLSNREGKNKTMDAIISIFTSHNNLNRQFKYINAFPISLGDLNFDVSLSDSEPMKCEATFQYTYFEIIK